TCSEGVTIKIWSWLQAGSAIVPAWPLPVAYEPEKLTVPKLASGSTLQKKTLQLEGASATHSAELSAAPFSGWVVVKLWFRVVSVIVSVKLLPAAATWAETPSPGWIVSESVTGAAGYISYQA